MKLGFLGTGAMTSALVTGLSSADGEPPSIFLSPRNAAVAAELVSRFPQVSTALSNQAVLDQCDACWLSRHGMPQAQARDYIVRMFAGVANSAVECPGQSFQSLTSDFATKGGINEQILAHLVDRGAFRAVAEALDAVMSRIAAGSR